MQSSRGFTGSVGYLSANARTVGEFREGGTIEAWIPLMSEVAGGVESTFLGSLIEVGRNT